MGALSKYTEDNRRIAEERMRDLESDPIETVKTVKKLTKKEIIANPFTPKKGHLETFPHRGEIAMFFQQYLYEEWRNFLLAKNWRWSKPRKCWIAKNTNENYHFAYKFISGHDEPMGYADLYVGDEFDE